MELMRGALQRDYVSSGGKLEIHFTRPWKPVEVPVEPLKIEMIDFPPAGILGSMVAGFELWSGKERLGAGKCRCKRRFGAIYRWPIAVDARPVASQADIVLERRDALEGTRGLHSVSGERSDAGDGRKRPRPGRRSGPVGPPAGRSCTVGSWWKGCFQDGLLTISLKVEALEDGALGQTVRVRNPENTARTYWKDTK